MYEYFKYSLARFTNLTRLSSRFTIDRNRYLVNEEKLYFVYH
jgi:hypothetical protein